MTHRGGDEAPLPLITFEKNKYELGKAALEMIAGIQGPIGVIAVAGLYRTGKSYLLNRLLGRQKGFDIGPTVNPCTKGIYIWGKPIKGHSPSGESMTFLIIDTEGLGSISADQTHDAKIFSLAILLSSFFIYNSMGTIDETALDKLSLVLNLTQHIHVRAKGGKEDESRLAAYFPAFLWVVRDFTLQLKDEEGNDISEKEYLERALTERSGSAEQIQSKNRIRRSIRTFFTNRDCTTLVRPVSDERQLQNIDGVPFEKLRDEFRKKMDRIKDRVFQSTPMKMQDGIPLNGAGFAALVRVYVDALNKGAVPSLQDGWHSAVVVQCTKAKEESIAEFERVMKSKWDESKPIDDSTLEGFIRHARDRAEEHFTANALGDRDHSFAKQLHQKIDEEAERLRRANTAHSAKRCEEHLRNAFSQFQEQMESGKFTSQKQLLDAWKKMEAEYNKATAACSDKARKETLDKYTEKLHQQILPQYAQIEKDRHEKELKAEAALRAKIEAEKAELRDRQHQAELKLQAEAAKREGLQEKFDRAETDRKSLQNRIDRLEAEVSRLQKEKADLEKEMKSAHGNSEKETRQLQQKIDKLMVEKGHVDTELARERSAKGTADGDLTRERGRVAKLERELDEANQQRDTKSAELRTVQKELSSLREENLDLRTQLRERTSELSAARATRPASAAVYTPVDVPEPEGNGDEEEADEDSTAAKSAKGKKRGAPAAAPAKKAGGGAKKAKTEEDSFDAKIAKLTIVQLKELLIKANVKPPLTAKAKADYVRLCTEHSDKVEPLL